MQLEFSKSILNFSIFTPIEYWMANLPLCFSLVVGSDSNYKNYRDVLSRNWHKLHFNCTLLYKHRNFRGGAWADFLQSMDLCGLWGWHYETRRLRYFLKIGARSFFLQRTERGRVRGFYNVCRHRGHELVPGRKATAGGSSVPTTTGLTTWIEIWGMLAAWINY